MDIKDFPMPQNVSEMRNLLEQFAAFLPQDKYRAISAILEKIELENGISSDSEGQAILLEVLNMFNTTDNA